jgi:hypothetical protein
MNPNHFQKKKKKKKKTTTHLAGANTMCADAVWWRHVAGKHMCAATATMMPSPMK